jgi:hypothetical protein
MREEQLRCSPQADAFPNLLQLAKGGHLNLKTIRHFIIDECDKVLEGLGEPAVPALLCGQ